LTTSDFDAVAVKLAGVFGAVVSMRFLQGSWLSRTSMACGGALCSYFAAPYVAQRVGIPEGLSGFLLGLFGMAIISRAWEWVQSTPVAAFWQIILDWLKKRAGL
jgi:hypothetical protein